MKQFLTCDTGGSGHGTVGREFVKHLLDKDIELNVSTHCWAWNLRGWRLGSPNRQFPDLRMRENLIKSERVNPEYLLDHPRDFRDRPHGVEDLSFSMEEAEPHDLMIKDFDGKEDVNMAIGGLNFAERQPDDCYRITEITHNTTKIPRKFRKYQNMTDEIWVPCEWSKRGLMNGGIDEDKIMVMPYGVDFHEPTFNDRIWQLNDDTFTFGTVGRWTNLKGMDVLIEAFMEEFVPDQDDVRLFIKTTVNYQRPLDANMVSNSIGRMINDLHILDPPEIGLMTDPLSLQEYWDMLGAFDAFVLSSRAEAIGISIVQAMGIGKPVIATDYSAIRNYLDDTVGFPVEIEGEVPVQQHSDLLYFYDSEYSGAWAQPSKDDLKRQMRKVYEMSKNSPGELEKKGKKAKERVRKIFDWEKHTKARLERIKEVAS